jgi:hypothetical protein
MRKKHQNHNKVIILPLKEISFNEYNSNIQYYKNNNTNYRSKKIL